MTTDLSEMSSAINESPSDPETRFISNTNIAATFRLVYLFTRLFVYWKWSDTWSHCREGLRSDKSDTLVRLIEVQFSADSLCSHEFWEFLTNTDGRRGGREHVTRMWKKKSDDARWLKESVAFIGQSLGGSSLCARVPLPARRPSARHAR